MGLVSFGTNWTRDIWDKDELDKGQVGRGKSWTRDELDKGHLGQADGNQITFLDPFVFSLKMENYLGSFQHASN